MKPIIKLRNCGCCGFLVPWRGDPYDPLECAMCLSGNCDFKMNLPPPEKRAAWQQIWDQIKSIDSDQLMEFYTNYEMP
jgi:hypothetical protein